MQKLTKKQLFYLLYASVILMSFLLYAYMKGKELGISLVK